MQGLSDLNSTSVCSKSFLCSDWSCQNRWFIKLRGHELVGSELAWCRGYGNLIHLRGLLGKISRVIFSSQWKDSMQLWIYYIESMPEKDLKNNFMYFWFCLLISQEGSLVCQFDFLNSFPLQVVCSKYCQKYFIQLGKSKMRQVLTNLQIYKSVSHPQRNFFLKKIFPVPLLLPLISYCVWFFR